MTPAQRAVLAAFKVMVIVRPGHRPAYRTANNIPQTMPPQVEAVVRRALEALTLEGEEGGRAPLAGVRRPASRKR